MAASNNNYSFLSGGGGVNFYTFDPEMPASWVYSVSTNKPFVFYAEETNVIYNPSDTNLRGAVQKLTSSTNFLGFASHIHATQECFGRGFSCPSYHLPLPAQSFNLTEEFVNRPLHDASVWLIYTGSWRCGKHQKFNRGFHIADAAFNIAKRKCPDLKICFVDNYIKTGDLISKQQFPLDVSIISGHINFRQMAHLLTACDVYVLPSTEIHANSLLEAMQCGLALITSDEFGIDEFNIGNGAITRLTIRKSEVLPNYGRTVSPEELILHNPRKRQTQKFIRLVADEMIDLYENRSKLVEYRRRSLELVKTKFNINQHQTAFANMLRGKNGLYKLFI
jgi:glycosyltransferase involved in cell wall biosynthesis